MAATIVNGRLQNNRCPPKSASFFCTFYFNRFNLKIWRKKTTRKNYSTWRQYYLFFYLLLWLYITDRQIKYFKLFNPNICFEGRRGENNTTLICIYFVLFFCTFRDCEVGFFFFLIINLVIVPRWTSKTNLGLGPFFV